MIGETFYILRHKTTKEIIRQQDTKSNPTEKPALFINARRARQARTLRQEIENPVDWDLVPVKVVEIGAAA